MARSRAESANFVPFKEKKTISARKQEVNNIRAKVGEIRNDKLTPFFRRLGTFLQNVTPKLFFQMTSLILGICEQSNFFQLSQKNIFQEALKIRFLLIILSIIEKTRMLTARRLKKII